MNGVAQTLVACIVSGAVFASICAALVVPAIAWIAVRLLAPAIHKMNGDWRAQAALAAFAASIPGALFLFLVGYGLVTSASSPCLQTIPGRALFGMLAALMLAAIVRTIVQAMRRSRDAANTVAAALPAPPRLARLAVQAGVSVYHLPDDVQSIVMLYGGRRAAVYVSTKALHDLSDDELLAALHHERAHQKRGDHRIAPVLYFLTDLLPLPVGDLVGTYRRSREFCADGGAVQHVASSDLASALLQMAAPQNAPAHAAAFAEAAVIPDRLRALLLHEVPNVNQLRRAVVIAALLAIVAGGVAVPQIASVIFHCSNMGLSS